MVEERMWKKRVKTGRWERTVDEGQVEEIVRWTDGGGDVRRSKRAGGEYGKTAEEGWRGGKRCHAEQEK